MLGQGSIVPSLYQVCQSDSVSVLCYCDDAVLMCVLLACSFSSRAVCLTY